MNSVAVCLESPRTVDATRLLAEAFVELARRYPEYSQTDAALFPVEQAEQPGGGFLVARLADTSAVGCVVLRPLLGDGEPTGEMKRMFVVPEARGRGIASALVLALENEARRLGYTRLRLETGTLQPEAMALYEKHGFVCIPCWGDHVDDPHSVCYEKLI